MDQKIINNKNKITVMKTQEQIKQEIVSYLTKTADHTFIKPKATFKWGDSKTPGYYEYDYDNFTYFKIMIENGEFYSLENSGALGYKVSKIDIDNYIKYWGNNSKGVLSNSLFLDKKMKSVKSNRYHLEEIEKIKESVK
jgi:hypothetical protein